MGKDQGRTTVKVDKESKSPPSSKFPEDVTIRGQEQDQLATDDCSAGSRVSNGRGVSQGNVMADSDKWTGFGEKKMRIFLRGDGL